MLMSVSVHNITKAAVSTIYSSTDGSAFNVLKIGDPNLEVTIFLGKRITKEQAETIANILREPQPLVEAA